MKWWVGLLALLLILFFGLIGVFYVRTFVAHRADGIIVIVANGLDSSLLNKARHQAAARGQTLNIDALSNVAIVDVQGLDQPVPDEASASTALASGRRVRNGLVGVTADATHLDSLIYAAQKAGRSTGLVTNRELTRATPLAFYGRTPGQPAYEARSAAELIDTSGIDVILGGGADYFTPATLANERGRTDGRDLVADAAGKGYTLVRTGADLDRIPTWRTRQLLGLFAPGDFTFGPFHRGATTEPSLSSMAATAIKCLQYNVSGYLLVIEDGLIGKAARNNWTDVALDEVFALDAAVGTTRSYAGKQALILVTSNFSLGSLDTAREDLALPPPPVPAATAAGALVPPAVPTSETVEQGSGYEWLAGPGGVPKTDADKAWLRAQYASGLFSPNPADLHHPAPAVRFARHADLTAGPAWIAAGGVGAERFSGFIPNEKIFSLVQDLF
ncbi:alkaline phosphatase [Verrucomicrobium sp. GAS474]|uniref:alkaline phosphatase n=1 Tax=Verrucomicrobium sp. GAS474 TaxID=1882831 RepID=UPI00087DED25|nr:alkaline phosphatase [Verrucomicrobium sp. GAS474]SDT92544.1 alkaline phosphatase [Verrucomicrobium sp. GAS474]